MAAETTPPANFQEFSQIFYYGGLAIAALVAGWLGYRRGPTKAEDTTTSVVGAIVDNRAVAPLIAAMERLTLALEQTAERMEHEERNQRLREELMTKQRLEELLARLERAKAHD